jgi:hypothetical protein
VLVVAITYALVMLMGVVTDMSIQPWPQLDPGFKATVAVGFGRGAVAVGCVSSPLGNSSMPATGCASTGVGNRHGTTIDITRANKTSTVFFILSLLLMNCSNVSFIFYLKKLPFGLAHLLTAGNF